ncbi:hypothetical protein [Clostridium rectalis]|uniref:hypothetical protein n=1 Tax=Clostridium rectalis TaxID=2040295 RepID=UPI000F632EFF|nr:hypothetical protein [Clostridium rectalis]
MGNYKAKSIFLIVIVLGLGFYLIKYEKEDYTKVFTLDEKDFVESTLGKDKDEVISLNKVEKVSIPFDGIGECCDFVDDENIVCTTRNSSDSFVDSKDNKINYFQINILNIKENKSKPLSPIHNKSQNFMISSPDKKKIFYSAGKDILDKSIYKVNDNENKSFIYSLKDQKAENIDYKTFLKWMPDSSGYIGVKDKLFFHDTNLNKNINILDEKKVKKLGNIFDICISKDCKNIFLQCYKWDEDFYSYIYHINLDKPNKVSFIFKGNIKKIDALDNENLIFTGKFNNEKALFIYNVPKRDINLLLDDEVIMFKLSNDRKNIAYVKMDKEGNKNLYAAKVYKNSISYNLMIYKNIYIKNNNLNWSEDNKKLVASFYEDKEDGENLMYIFYFK